MEPENHQVVEEKSLPVWSMPSGSGLGTRVKNITTLIAGDRRTSKTRGAKFQTLHGTGI